ncbi:MAG: TPM domain-containing protein [Pseudomonadota bacterium]
MKGYSRASHFFNPAEKEAIESATRAAEFRTIGEIAVMVVDASSRYREAEVFGGITLGNIIAFFVTVFFFHESIWWYVPLTFVFFFPSWLLFRKIPDLKIHLAGQARREFAVQGRALRAFYEKGLYRTAGSTGVLFFISILERKVWVLADKGIYEKITQARLNGFAQAVSEGIRQGRAADALIGAIHDAGELLREHFPILDGDTNELPDTIMIGSKSDDD